MCVGQFSAKTDKAANRAELTGLIASAAGAGADLVALPEAAMYDFGPPAQPLSAAAEKLDGEFVSSLHELASRHQVTVIAGMFEISDDPDRPYNTLVLVDADGLRASYRKTYLYDSFGYRESDRLSPGPGAPVVVPVGAMQVGLLTCYDLRFPEIARSLVAADADLLVVPAAWVRGPLKEDHWQTLVRARAIENTVFVAAAAQCGDFYCGRSMIVDPMGVVMSALGEQPGLAVADVRIERRDEVRRVNPSLVNRRPELGR
jgi:deaminated glutathione amidase